MYADTANQERYGIISEFCLIFIVLWRCPRSRIRPTIGRMYDKTALFSSVSPNTDTTSMLRLFHLRDEINSFVILSNLSLVRTEFFGFRATFVAMKNGLSY